MKRESEDMAALFRSKITMNAGVSLMPIYQQSISES